MHAEFTSSSQELTEYFKTEMQDAESEVAILGSIVIEILASGQVVNNKAIIAQLLHRLETTSDVVALDTYRHVLEMVVHRTDDDLIG